MSERGKTPVVVQPGQGAAMMILGDTTTCKVDGRATGGSHSLFETLTPPGGGTPPHVHRREDETFYVLEGDVEFWVEGKTIKVGAGGTVFAPRDIPHCYRNTSSKPARMLVFCSPPGMEDFFSELAREVPSLPPDVAKVVAVCAKYGIEILPPK